MTFQRVVQGIALAGFLILLLFCAFPLVSPVPVDLFLRLDPLVFLTVSAGARTWIAALWPGLAMLLLGLVLGRFFCAYVCPMGTTIDIADWLLRKLGRKPSGKTGPRLAAPFLFALLGAAALGVSFVFLGSPLSLVTRFYGLLAYPMAALTAQSGMSAFRPVANTLDWTGLAYAQIDVPRFAMQWLTALIFLAIFSLGLFASRFWCRYVCPAGAALALCSRRPMIRRQVSEDCIDCGKCRRNCPMEAIGEDFRQADHGRCIACQACVRVCPVDAVRFDAGSFEPAPKTPVSLARREVVLGGVSGMAGAMLSMTGLMYLQDKPSPGQVLIPEMIRPPGAVPESEFLRHCIRCGECMKVCPTNTLQPMGVAAGFAALFSPKIAPRRGACEPLCNACGQVCPTGAIRALSPDEKLWAKVGTAQVLPQKCLAWEWDRRCLVCDEVCPYNAIDLKQIPNLTVGVPFVDEKRCSGCGMCAHLCPVQAEPAIVVTPMAALRLSTGSYMEKAKEAGLDLKLVKQNTADEPPSGGVPDGYSPNGDPMPQERNGGLPPGFTD